MSAYPIVVESLFDRRLERVLAHLATSSRLDRDQGTYGNIPGNYMHQVQIM